MSENNQEQDYITLIDEDGNESLYEVLFTFESEDFGKSYVFLYPAGTGDNDEVELTAYSYIENEDDNSGQLNEIETQEEWEMVDEVLNTFLNDENL